PRLGNVRIDPDRVRQVVWNLVHNAVKFTPPGGRVTVSLHRSRDALQIEVKDTGQGIAREFLPHVFERFRQADTSPTRTHGGLGLGLAIARQLVELHGGTIRVDSAGVGKGATFAVELPASALVHKPPKIADEPPGGGQAGFVARPVLKGMRILLVEDDEHTRNVIAWLLEQCSATVIAVESAAAALREFKQTIETRRKDPAASFNLMISDIAMPDRDGYDLIRQVRKLEQSAGIVLPLPAIALTAYVRERHRAQAMEAGFQDYIPKPIDPEALIATALGLLQQKERKIPAGKD
ncbi:MAG TPA: ATP-binding protein, partial [Tepidisphaeraceae bacterium]|nr:ATP-binding protein [Tepidisphaeraceae bacterium]